MLIKHLWNRIIVNFINGIVILLPIMLTVTIVRFLVIQVNKIILDPLIQFFTPIVVEDKGALVARIITFFIVIAALSFIGWCTRILFLKKIFLLGEKILMKVPVMGKIYNAAKQIFSSFFGKGKTIFKQVVLVEYPRKGLFSIGFTTGESKGEVKESVGCDGVNVFIPTTPNPTSGIFLIIPRDGVRFMGMSVEEGMKLVVSGGAVSPETASEIDAE